jgi:hypothetical protein
MRKYKLEKQKNADEMNSHLDGRLVCSHGRAFINPAELIRSCCIVIIDESVVAHALAIIL